MDSTPEVVDMDTDAAVEEATEFGMRLIQSILNRAPFAVVKAQVDAGAPLWFQDEEGTSALHAAAYVENEELSVISVNAPLFELNIKSVSPVPEVLWVR